MEQFPLHLAIFGLADRVFEPFCYGCAGFLLSFRISRTILSKVTALVVTAFAFLWMDDIWPGIAAREANLGAALSSYGTNPLVEGGRLIGQAEFSTGEVAGLWEVFVFSAWDLGSALIFVSLAFFLGLKITGRRWNEINLKPTAPDVVMAAGINSSASIQLPSEQGSWKETALDSAGDTEGNSLDIVAKEKHMDPIDPKKPTKVQYIGAWMVMGVVNLFVSYFLYFLVPNVGGLLLQEAYFWYLVMAPLSALIPIFAFYLTYNVWFKSLNGWRVLPWLYVLGTLGFMSSTGNSLPVLTQLIGQENADFFALISMAVWFIALFVIRKFIVGKSGHVK